MAIISDRRAARIGYPSVPHCGAFFGLALCFLIASCALPAAALNPDSPAGTKEADHRKPYALIFGTVWDAAARPVAGVKIKIRRSDQKKAKWELMSDSRGEFAQRLPAGKADYVVWPEVKTKHSATISEVKVHIENDERADISVHLTE